MQTWNKQDSLNELIFITITNIQMLVNLWINILSSEVLKVTRHCQLFYYFDWLPTAAHTGFQQRGKTSSVTQSRGNSLLKRPSVPQRERKKTSRPYRCSYWARAQLQCLFRFQSKNIGQLQATPARPTHTVCLLLPSHCCLFLTARVHHKKPSAPDCGLLLPLFWKEKERRKQTGGGQW